MPFLPSDEMRMAADILTDSPPCTGQVANCGCDLAEGLAKLLNQMAEDWDGDPTQVDADECDESYGLAIDMARRIKAVAQGEATGATQ